MEHHHRKELRIEMLQFWYTFMDSHYASQLFRHPHRTSRHDHFIIILRGFPGSGILNLSSSSLQQKTCSFLKWELAMLPLSRRSLRHVEGVKLKLRSNIRWFFLDVLASKTKQQQQPNLNIS
ncbi:hypothetical protein TanjilG_03229 [Lupinus angustifolius]|uniref:Uncharacterized protein n=1 Tax=Lupinus angustifolius TaxID=3871 RepID=A0A4P1RDG0_LUPAN|nr:hypothetical protein TanjilG_03229 [Lupinus angustifolius]